MFGEKKEREKLNVFREKFGAERSENKLEKNKSIKQHHRFVSVLSCLLHESLNINQRLTKLFTDINSANALHALFLSEEKKV